jgi:hypothetical protein
MKYTKGFEPDLALPLCPVCHFDELTVRAVNSGGTPVRNGSASLCVEEIEYAEIIFPGNHPQAAELLG